MVFMDRRCGSWQIGEHAEAAEVEFRVFFPAGADPHVTGIRAVGDFQTELGDTGWDPSGGIPLTVEPGDDPLGTFWSARVPRPLPAGFYEYQYLVDFDQGSSRHVTDPCARYSGLSHRNSGFVVGGSSPAENTVRPVAGGRLPLTDLTVYELMIDDFTAGYREDKAPLEAVIDKLDALAAMGITAIEFMPWTAWKHTDFDWGYEPFQYFAVETRYANRRGVPQEKLSWLKRVVNACHDRGIHVIMDGVFNHVSRDFPYPRLYRDPTDCPFTAGSFGGTFPGLQDLDFHRAITGQLVHDVCTYWIDTFGIDGIRFDNTVNFHVPGNLRGLPEILTGITEHVAARGEKNFSLTLEHIDVSAAQVTNDTAATSFWDDSLYGQTFSALWNDTLDPGLLNALNNRRWLVEGKTPTLYLSNHDHSHVAWQAGARENLGASTRWWKVQPFLIALFTSTATPLVRNGDELGEETFLPEDDAGTGRRVTPRPLRWKLAGDRIGNTLTAVHARLAALRRSHPALRSPYMYPDHWDTWQTRFNPVGVGVDTERRLAIYHRWAPLLRGFENVVVVLNFSDSDQWVETPFPFPGRWTDLLAGFDGGHGYSVDVPGATASVQVGGHWGRILHAVNPG
jgi:pullulanase